MQDRVEGGGDLCRSAGALGSGRPDLNDGLIDGRSVSNRAGAR